MYYDILKRKPAEIKYIKPAFLDGYNKAIDDINKLRDYKIQRQEKFTSKVLCEMIERGIVNPSKSLEAKMYLEQLYSIGLNEGGVVHAHRKEVSGFNESGIKIGTYPSATHAANDLGLDKTTISKAATGKIPTAGGYFWRYES